MLFGRLRILGKLGLLVLVPLLGVLALSIAIVVNRVDTATTAQHTADTVTLATEVGSTVQELQEERLLSVGYLLGLAQGPDLVAQSARAQDRLEGLTRLGEPLSTAMAGAVANAAKLNNTRNAVLNRRARPDLIVTDFTSVITPLITALQLPSDADLRTAVGRQVFALDQAMRTNDQINQASAYLTAAVVAQNSAFIGLFYSVLVQLQGTIGQGQEFFTPAQYKLYLATQEAFSTRVGSEFLVKAATDPNAAVKVLNKTNLFPSLVSVNVLGSFVEKRIAADVSAAVTKNRNDALRAAILVGGGSLLLLLIVVLLSALMARAVARPLRRLTQSADRVARAAESELERVADDETESARPIRLDPVDVAARDEIGDLARAFDRVQSTAARLVERQVVGRRNVAQMFGHVGRRAQNLVGRQLALIDNLERRETDTDRLRELYRLDHMSSRLRRNAGSLVVLSGGAGTNEHMAPLPLEDVVRLALGEIEDYTRVDVDVPEEIVVLPAVLADLTLLLAELMENATSFSPPNTRVTVVANELRGGARLAVIDQGLGLAPERLAEENARLTRRERLDLAPTEVLGLFVVGRLARRHGIEVTLTDTPEGGVTAWVDLRPQHLVSRADTMAPVPPIQATIGHLAEFVPLIAGRATRSAPGSAQPFDANMLSRATETLESGRSWNAFAIRTGPPAIEAAPSSSRRDDSGFEIAPVHAAEPVGDVTVERRYDSGTPVAGRHPAARPELPAGRPMVGRYAEVQPPLVMEGPIVPAEGAPVPRQRRPHEHTYGTPQAHAAAPQIYPGPPAHAGQPPGYAQPPQARQAQTHAGQPPGYAQSPQARQAQTHAGQPPVYAQPPQAEAGRPSGVVQAQVATPSAPAEAPQAAVGVVGPPQVPARPRQGSGNGGGSPLRRRVPGSQLPAEAGPKVHATTPTSDDAQAAREAFDAFEAGVNRAQWDAIEADMSSPPAAGHAPLARRVPGASLPPAPPTPTKPAAPAAPMDPEAARALVEQFEYGVALALSESQPQHEGQPR